MAGKYPWYKTVRSTDHLEQGDIFFGFPVYIPRAYPVQESIPEYPADIVILTQSCDLNKLRISKSAQNTPIVFCPLKSLKEEKLAGRFNPDDPLTGWTATKKEQIVSRRVIPSHTHRWSKHNFDFQIINLKQIYTAPYHFIKEFANRYGTRIRLLPPYREHLAQAFAKQFMRVGLPEDLPEDFPYPGI